MVGGNASPTCQANRFFLHRQARQGLSSIQFQFLSIENKSLLFKDPGDARKDPVFPEIKR
jgi:hypothetical protein